ncbi:MAG: DUF2225 domain-containing protein [Nitrospirae bacterium]|nr:DUF2225 domain-containing protein [Nitrospirota bacterium]
MLQNRAVSSFPKEFKDIDKSSTGVLMERQFGCPFDKTEFTAPGLKTKALQTQTDDFYLTKYTEAIGDRTYIDYSLFDIKICPACLYANRDSGFRIYDSINKSWREPRELTISEKYVEAMNEGVGRRFRIAAQAGLKGHRLFSAERTLEDAVIAASLAVDFVATLLTVAPANEKAGLLYLKGLFHIQMSQCYHKIELLSPKDSAQLHQDFRFASLSVAMDAFNELENSLMQDKYFQGLHKIMLYYYQKLVVSEFIGDKKTFDASRQVIRKYYGDYCLGMGKGTEDEKKAAKLFFDAIDEGARQYDQTRSLA